MVRCKSILDLWTSFIFLLLTFILFFQGERETMDSEYFDMLEAQIVRAGQLIDRLKEERTKAQMESQELRTRLTEAVEEINTLKEENQRLQETSQRRMALLDEKKEKLRSQIETMISKLDTAGD